MGSSLYTLILRDILLVQVYEMYVAGYSFYLLNNAFTNHWGFQSLKTRPQWRARQQEQNNARFDEFDKEVGFY